MALSLCQKCSGEERHGNLKSWPRYAAGTFLLCNGFHQILAERQRWRAVGKAKAVSDQIEERKSRPQVSQSVDDRSPETVLRRQQLESLRLSRARTLAQIEQASCAAYRQMLEGALRTFEERIEEVSRQLAGNKEPKT